MQTSIRSTTDSTQHGDLPRTENDGANSWKRLRSSLELARDDDDDDESYKSVFKIDDLYKIRFSFRFLHILYLICCVIKQRDGWQSVVGEKVH